MNISSKDLPDLQMDTMFTSPQAMPRRSAPWITT